MSSITNLTEILNDHPGDVTLTFSGSGGHLRVHSHILALASDVLQGALEACVVINGGISREGMMA